MKPFDTLVLLASEREARLLVHRGPGKGLAEIMRFDTAHNIEYADRRGRDQGGNEAGHHTMEPSTGPRRQNRQSFAADILSIATEEWARGGYNRFVMSAPPAMLGELRQQIGAPLKDALAGDLNKDIVGLAADDLAVHFEDTIKF